MLLPPPGLSKSAADFVKSACFNVSGAFPGYVTFALPSGLTSTVAPGFTASIAFLSLSCSSLSKFVGFLATNLLPGTRAELIALIACAAASLTLSTSAFFLAPVIAASVASLMSSTSFLSFSLAASDNVLSS